MINADFGDSADGGLRMVAAYSHCFELKTTGTRRARRNLLVVSCWLSVDGY